MAEFSIVFWVSVTKIKYVAKASQLTELLNFEGVYNDGAMYVISNRGLAQ